MPAALSTPTPNQPRALPEKFEPSLNGSLLGRIWELSFLRFSSSRQQAPSSFRLLYRSSFSLALLARYSGIWGEKDNK
jgi:hypothetical protein